MPSGTGVVDAFKSSFSTACSTTTMTSNLQNFLDLIRHGKQHQSPRNNDSPTSPTKHTAEQHSSGGTTNSSSSRRREAAATAPKSTPKPEPPIASPPVNDAEMQPVHREAAEQIVKEERQAKDRMPSYKGLENFQLMEKMGEYVPLAPGMTCGAAFSD